ncbi:hypothetical protein DMC30DRAFT_444537 [Rhodotorula diobovata]|uniref:Uncharacterized protein n=1 Tax=Rhodotorula diobovata TaxID=5288 RepID=A0A5C5G5R3_9BASI|nr:hypothetical protein DMC30DRAFT_444537 [Rhodotorula diobovata]
MADPRPTSDRTAASTPPEPFLLGILHLVLSPFPAPLPPALLSQTTRQAIHYLSISPDEDSYWTCGRNDQQVALRRRELIEAGNLDDLVLSHARFSFDLNETKALISLSLPYSGGSSGEALGVVLAWEDNTSPLAAATGGAPSTAPGQPLSDDDVRPGWTFLELQVVDDGSPSPHWHSSLNDAVESATASLGGALARDSPSSRGEPAAEASEEAGEGRARFGAAAGVDDCEGTTPGGIGSADDFWSGWSDDEGDGKKGEVWSNGGGRGAMDEQEAEDEYWSSYGAVDSQVGGEEPEEDDRETVEPAVAARARRSSTITPGTSGLVAAPPGPVQPVSPTQRSLPPPPLRLDPSRLSAVSASQGSSAPSPTAAARPSTPPSHAHAGPATPTRQAFPSPRNSHGNGTLERSPATKGLSSPQRPAHTRQASDVTKALPSFPAFPVLPRTKSSRDSAVVQSGQASAPASPRADKTLPPAPEQGLYTPPPPRSFAPQYSDFLPVGPGAAGAVRDGERPRQGSLTSPLPSTATFASPFGGALQQAHEPAHERQNNEQEHEEEQERLRLDRLASAGSLDGGLSIASGDTSLTSVLLGPGRSFSASGAQDATPGGGRAGEFPLPPMHAVNGGAAGGQNVDESLRFAMAGLWGLWSAGARTPAEREEKRRAWERVAGEVVRS